MNTIVSPSRHVELPEGCFFRLHDLMEYLKDPKNASVFCWVIDWVASQSHPVVVMLHAPDEAFAPENLRSSLTKYAKSTYVKVKWLKRDMTLLPLFNRELEALPRFFRELEANVTQHWIVNNEEHLEIYGKPIMR